jgi:hypothetical protein
MGILFELLNGTEKLACNFYYSTVSPDHQAGTGVPRNPGLCPGDYQQPITAAGNVPTPWLGALATQVPTPRGSWRKAQSKTPG